MRRYLIFILLCWPLWASAQKTQEAQEAQDWIAYRDAYRQMIWFEKYGKPKQFLQNHFRIRAREKGASTDGLRLSLNSKNIHQSLTLDVLGRAVFPFSKAAYDDNAELTLNRNASQFRSGAWVSIVTRADGVYAAADLRTACEQMLAYLQYAGAAAGKACVGVQFSYPRSDAAEVVFQTAGGASTALVVREGPAFPDDVQSGFRVVAYRFAAYPENGRIVSSSVPLAIAALLE
ncbi:hypothetical protein GTP23_17280 [Pseudoduganella sp. FT93W]|uniref:DUF2987 domain-containing protein n=1 Tax=Duganella fentianensis TaxID=2692177 RepID=A0A845I658_9BURK|nr:hypothetical protein [Duganella fentianensis]MYN46798.1 hypothetical protein [Duganella fentianensis]